MVGNQVVILGAGRAVHGSSPAAVLGTDADHGVLDWVLDAFSELDTAIAFVAGYRADEVIERYPDVRVVLNRQWERTGPVASLGLVARRVGADAYVCYSDVLFRRAAINALRADPADVTIAVDTAWRRRYDGRTRSSLDAAEKVVLDGDRVTCVGRHVDTAGADAEFAGVMRLRGAAADHAFSTCRSGALGPTAGLPELIGDLIDAGFAVAAVDLDGDWAELDAKQDLARFVLGTKAESLERLRGMHHGGEIPPLVAFTWDAWSSAPDAVLDRVQVELTADRFIVRSSALEEDSWLASRAGHHVSVPDVECDRSALTRAIDEVFASYDTEDLDHQVLIQPMLHDVMLSGVVMTRTHAGSAPFYVLNFDESAATDAVTSGRDSRTIVVHRDASLAPTAPAALADVLNVVQNVEKLVGHDSLDIEFAVTAGNVVHILQVRPIATTHQPFRVDDADAAAAIARARQHIANSIGASATLLGTTTRYSVMSDWNPAEIIGTKPRRLATSLYRRLVTDEVWAQQRAEFGYRDVRPCPLLVEIAGHPYIDVRASLNSFLPAALDDALAACIVDVQLERLTIHPELHDKIEFEVALTCLTVDHDARAARILGDRISAEERRQLGGHLRTITIDALARIEGDLLRVERLERAIDDLGRRDLAPLDAAYHDLELVRRVGAPVFAHLARLAFIATSLLRSVEAVGATTPDETAKLLSSVETVLGTMRRDALAVARGELDWLAFVDRYGHLRPGTYDITSPCYRDAPELYLGGLVRDDALVDTSAPDDAAIWGSRTRSAVDAALRAVDLPCTSGQLVHFAARSIAAREHAKFVFTRALSRALEHIAAFGEGLGLTRDDLAHIAVHDILAARDARPDVVEMLARRVEEGRAALELTQALWFPAQIASADDLLSFEQRRAEPNFVTRRAVEAPVASTFLGPGAHVDGHVVVIANADPGFDWLLARPIAGLVTMYGGANSHMAVRAAELDLPAAIGVGELSYAAIASARVVRLDCASRTIVPVR